MARVAPAVRERVVEPERMQEAIVQEVLAIVQVLLAEALAHVQEEEVAQMLAEEEPVWVLELVIALVAARCSSASAAAVGLAPPQQCHADASDRHEVWPVHRTWPWRRRAADF